jgi:hypothetical protein
MLLKKFRVLVIGLGARLTINKYPVKYSITEKTINIMPRDSGEAQGLRIDIKYYEIL